MIEHDRFDDETSHTHRVLAQGIDTSVDKLALDVIEGVGPGGHFLGQRHNRRTIRDIWLPTLTHPAPSADSRPPLGIRERARAAFRRILAEHRPEPLPRDVQLELSKILKTAERALS